jgi:rare lipoprotein A (peptidoglycan hydrolase)
MSPRPRQRSARHLPADEPAVDDGTADDGGLRVPTHRLAFALASTFAALPMIVVDNLPAITDADRTELVAEATVEPSAAPVTLPAPSTTTTTSAPATTTTVAPTTTTTTVPPTTVPPTTVPPTTTTTVAPTTTMPPTTVAPTTTTTSPPPPPTTTTAEAPAPPPPSEADAERAVDRQRGQATWYSQPDGYDARGCAHRTLPFGTVVTVSSGGRSTTCVVNDRGPYGAGRIIDLDDQVFAELAPLSAGVIEVTITW